MCPLPPALAATLAAAQQRQPRFPDLLPPHPDVEVVSKLVSVRDPAPGAFPEVPVGRMHSLLTTFINGGNSPLNVSGIIGTLLDPATGGHMFNFTGAGTGEVVEPGGEMSLEYRFVPPQFPSYPADLTLSIHVFYDGEAMGFSNTLYNETVTFVASEDSWEAVEVLPWALGLACVAVAVFTLPEALVGTNGWAATMGGKAKAEKAAVASKAAPSAVDDDFGSVLMGKKSAGTPASKGTPGKSSKKSQ